MGAMILLILAVIGLAGLPFALAVIHAESVSAWLAALPRRVRRRGWGLLLLLLPAAGAGAMHDRPDLRAAIPETLFAAVLLVYLPRLARKAVPFAVLALAGYLFVRLLRSYRGDDVMRGFMNQPLVNTWSGYLVPAVLGLLAAALWLAVRVGAPGAGPVRALAARWRGSARAGIHPAQAWLLPPVFVLAMELPRPGNRWLTLPLTAAVATACLVLVFRSRV